MKKIAPLALSGLVAFPAAAAEPYSVWDQLTLQNIVRYVAQTAVMSLRSVVDITYEAMSVSPTGGDITLTGVRIYPPVDNDDCVIYADALEITTSYGWVVSTSHLEFIGARAELACLPEDAAGPIAAVGYDALVADRFFIDTSYESGSSALDASVHLALRDAGVLGVESELDYFWIRQDLETGEPAPAILLSALEISYEDRGLLDRVKPILPPEMTNPDAAQAMVIGGLRQGLSQGGQAQLGEAATEFADSAGSAVASLLRDGGRLIISAEPEGGVWIDPEAMTSPNEVVSMLEPNAYTVQGAEPDTLIAPDVLQAALSGGDLSDEDRRMAGIALLTGDGAPRSEEKGIEILSPLADAGDADAAAALAHALADEEPKRAYGYALTAAAGGAEGALGDLARIEAKLDAAEILEAQGGSGDLSDQIVSAYQSGGVGGLREAALRRAAGAEEQRDYAAAYALASLAAAAGDGASAALRRTISRRMSAAEGDGDDWSTREDELERQVLEVWTEGGLLQELSQQ